jgi:hypothetical protein
MTTPAPGADATWETVVELLTTRVIPFVTVPDLAKSWVDGLSVIPEGERPGVCLAIDLVSDAIAPKVLAEVLDEIPSDFDDSARAFADAVDGVRHRLSCTCASALASPALDHGDSYLRVMEFGVFITRYLQRAFPHVSADAAGVKDAYELLSQPEFTLAAIDAWWAGGRDRVWVTLAKPIEDLVDNVSKDVVGGEVCDSLGLMFPGGVGKMGEPVMFAIKYPETFADRCVQPAAFDADWFRPSFFLSFYKVDGWGRTHRYTGAPGSLLERIHRPFKGLNADFSYFHIGSVAALSPEREALRSAGYKRLQESLNSGSVL